MIQFEWNQHKNSINKKKHGISFETAMHVFDDPYLLSWMDRTCHYEEERWIGLGAVENEIIIVVIHTLKVNENDEETIRIISARKANKTERRHYILHYQKD